MIQSSTVEGYVAEIVSSSQLIITPGRDEGVAVGDKFQVLAQETETVRDPLADQVLEEIPVVKATVRAIEVHGLCTKVENIATRTVNAAPGRDIFGMGGFHRIQEPVPLPIDDVTMTQVDRAIKVGDRCVKLDGGG